MPQSQIKDAHVWLRLEYQHGEQILISVSVIYAERPLMFGFAISLARALVTYY